MCDLQLMYRECGAETRDDYLRGIANEIGLSIACVRKIADRLEQTWPAEVIREVPGAHDQLPSKALSLAGGGPHGTDPRDPEGLKSLQRVFQFDLELPAAVGPVEVGTRVYVRFHHHAEPLAAQWGRRLRQLFLARFNV